MLAYLRVIYNPEDDIALLRIINTPPRGIGASTVEALTHNALQAGAPLTHALAELAKDPQRAGRSHRALAAFQKLLQDWKSIRDEVPAAELLTRIIEATGYRKKLERQESREEAANRLANIDELIRACEESEDRSETIFEFLDRAALSSELDHLDPNARVTLMTVHSAKGLEFDAVFLVGMEDGLFPHALSCNSPEDLEEERRLCYVGITRARRRLFLTWTPFRRSFGRDRDGPALPSRFLGEMPPELVEGPELKSDYAYEEDEEYETVPRELRRGSPRRDGEPRGSKTEGEEAPSTIAELRAYLEQQRAASAQADAGAAFKAGTRVRHAQFGDGIILKRERSGNDMKLTITFSRVGRKTLIERYAKLEAL